VFTPVYGWPFQALTDRPDGPNLGEDGFLAAEATVAGIDARVVALEGAVYRATARLAAPAASVTFSGIPTTLRRLTLSWTARSTNAAVAQNLRCRVNNDSTAVYNGNFTQQNNTTITGSVQTAATFWQVGVITGATAAASNFGAGEIVIPGWNAPHTNINHVHRSHMYEAAASSWLEHGGGLYFAAGPYNRLDLFADAGNLDTNSEFLLTGIV